MKKTAGKILLFLVAVAAAAAVHWLRGGFQ